jgi:hypothetical protein
MGKILKASLAALLFLIAFNSAYSKSCAPADSTAKEITGELESKKGKTVKVSISNQSVLPDVGMTGTLSKYFEEEILGMNTHGYIDIAEVEVKSVTDSEVTFTIIKELTNIKLNGKKENLFKKGIIVKFEW